MTPAAEPQWRVLVIDDDEVDRLAVQRALKQAAAVGTVEHACDATSGLARIAEGGLDVVLLDLQLPGRDGRWVLAEARARAIDTPIVVLTGHGDEQTVAELLRAGAADYLAKGSLTTERLASTIDHVLRTAAAERQAREAERELRRNAMQLSALASVSAQMIATVDEHELMHLCAVRGRDVLQVRTVVVRMLDCCGRALHAVSAEGEPTIDEGRPVPVVDVPCSMTSAALVADPARHRIASDLGLGLPLRGWMVAPMVSRTGDVLGLIHATDKVSGEFTDVDLAVLVQFAQITAVAFESSRRLRETERAANARRETLAVVAHDLRNPLTVIRLALGAAENAVVEPSTTKVLQRATRAAIRMETLITDLLDLGQIDEGRLVVRTGSHAVGALIDDVVNVLQPLAAAKNIHIETALPALPPVEADAGRIGRVLQNILVNAIKYTPRDGRIRLSAEPAGDMIRFCVRDTGPGIAREAIDHIFERFWRPSDDRQEGAGLGLAIAKGIVEAHGGTIGVTNSPDGGAVFSFTLKAAAPPPHPAERRTHV